MPQPTSSKAFSVSGFFHAVYTLRVTLLVWLIIAGLFVYLANVLAASV